MATYYVDTAVGNDSNAGTSEGAGNAWATIDKAMNTVAASDKVWVKASGNYNETATIDTVGAITTPITFEGYSSTTGDYGKVTIDGQSTRASCLTGATNATYYIFKNFKFINGTGAGVSLASADNVSFFNCEFNSNGGAGIDIDNNCLFINCVAASNGADGLEPDSNTTLIGCVLHSNTLSNLNAAAAYLIYRCVSYAPGSSSDCFDVPFINNAIGNTADGENSSDGWTINSDTTPVFIDNIIYDCGTGVLFSASLQEATNTFVGYNLINSNTTDYSGTTSGELFAIKDVTGAPAFTDEANDDYTLGAGSSAIDAGINPGGVT